MDNKSENRLEKTAVQNYASPIISDEHTFFVQWGGLILAVIFLIILANLVLIRYTYSRNYVATVQSIDPINNTLKILLIDENHAGTISSKLSRKKVRLCSIDTNSISKITNGLIIDVRKEEGTNNLNAVAIVQVPASIIRHDSIKLITDAQVELESRSLLHILFKNNH